jgi:Ca2+-transporting ATPase
LGAPSLQNEAVEAILQRERTDGESGLSSTEAATRLGQAGPNELPAPPRPSALAQFLSQFKNPIVLTLLAAAAIAIVDGASRSFEPTIVRFGDAIAILIIVAMNSLLGFFQERRAEAALDALEKMQTPHARVRRDDEVTTIRATQLVTGDILELEAGDAVPADARLLSALNLATEESALTGESVPVGKDATAIVADDAPLGDRLTMVFLGTNVVRGKGRAVVVSTATKTELGKLSLLMSEQKQHKTPLEQRLDHFGKRVLWGCLALSAILFGRGLLQGQRTWHELLLEAVSLAVAAIPEGLPAITTITLALGMQRMAKRGAIIRKLAAVETLGSATIICTDKTGTLTQNEMTVREILAGKKTYAVSGIGYDPHGEIRDPTGKVVCGTPSSSDQGPPAELQVAPLAALLASAALCNNARLERTKTGGWRTIGDPTEGALLALAGKGGVTREPLAESLKVVHEVPFDGDRKRMSIVTLDAEGREVVHTKGSCDVLLPLCDQVEADTGPIPLDDGARTLIQREAERMSLASLRVLAVARRELHVGRTPGGSLPPGSGKGTTPGTGDRPSGDLERHLTFLGLVGMIDPPRAGVKEAVRACADAQVRAVMITGDHKLTAVAIARELGLWEEQAMALTGSELEAMSDVELKKSLEHVRVFARVTAAQKLRIVRAFKQEGHVVAMTGDGVNDAPALREADIGVAMGKEGTDVAREAADMVIADDNFATIVDAVREGRAVYRNIQKFIFFLLSSNAGLLVAVFAASFFPGPGLKPLTPLMILWINLVTNGLPALALGIDPPDPTQMLEPPRKPSAGLLGEREYLGMAAVGVWMGGAALCCYVLPWIGRAELGLDPFDAGRNTARAVAFSLLALSPLFHASNCRSKSASIFSVRPFVSRPLVLAVVLSAGIHMLVFVPTLRPVFRTSWLTPSQWIFLLVMSASIVPAAEVVKWFQRRGILGQMGPMSRRL